LDIEQDYLRSQSGNCLKRADAVLGLTDHVEALGVEKHPR
jgi:hypothetical protein